MLLRNPIFCDFSGGGGGPYPLPPPPLDPCMNNELRNALLHGLTGQREFSKFS